MNSFKLCYPADGTIHCNRPATRFFTISDIHGNIWYRRYCDDHLIPNEMMTSMQPFGGVVEEVGEVGEAYFDAIEIHNS